MTHTWQKHPAASDPPLVLCIEHTEHCTVPSASERARVRIVRRGLVHEGERIDPRSSPPLQRSLRWPCRPPIKLIMSPRRSPHKSRGKPDQRSALHRSYLHMCSHPSPFSSSTSSKMSQASPSPPFQAPSAAPPLRVQSAYSEPGGESSSWLGLSQLVVSSDQAGTCEWDGVCQWNGRVVRRRWKQNANNGTGEDKYSLISSIDDSGGMCSATPV